MVPSLDDFCKAKRKKGDSMIQLITADDAKKETQKVIDAKADDILNEIATKIQDSIRKGDFFFYINKPLSDRVKTILCKNGYTVNDASNQFDGCCIKISWK
jgi:hypothetical protein